MEDKKSIISFSPHTRQFTSFIFFQNIVDGVVGPIAPPPSLLHHHPQPTSSCSLQVCFCALYLLALLLASLLCLAMHVKSVPSLFQPWALSQAPPSKLKPCMRAHAHTQAHPPTDVVCM